MALPEIGTRESQILDFKARVSWGEIAARLELAKDVAAMANAAGGSLIVGAAGGDTLQRWAPHTQEEANAACDAYEHAVRDLCLPPPLFSCAVEQNSAGSFACAVEIRPQLGPVVGVAVPVGRLPETRDALGAETAYRFPVRVGTHTRYFNPSNLPTSRERKIAAVLAALEEGEALELHARNENPGGRVKVTMRFVAVDPIAEVVMTRSRTGNENRPIPLFDIHNVLPPVGGRAAQLIYKNEARVRLH